MKAPRVKDFSTSGTTVNVTFSDGHSAIFQPFHKGFGHDIEGFKQFVLMKGLTEVFVYNGRMNTYYDNDSTMVVEKSPEYSQQLAASYWRAAKDYFSKSKDKAYRIARRVLCYEGVQYLNSLECGEAKEK